jgi:alpha-galactosidase
MSETTIANDTLRCEVDPATGHLALQIGQAELVGGCSADFSLSGQKSICTTGKVPVSIRREPAASVHGKGEQLVVDYGVDADLALTLETAIYPAHPFVLMRVGAANRGTQPIHLHKLTPLSTTALRFGSGPLDGWVNGYHSWSFAGFIPHTHRQPRTSLGWLTFPLAHNTTTALPGHAGCYAGEEVAALVDGHRCALVAGFIGMADQFGQVYANGHPGKQSITLQTTTDGVPIDPGETLWGEWAILYTVDLPGDDPLGLYADAVARLTPGRFPSDAPPPGWSSWYQFFGAITSDEMARNQQALRDLREHLPLRLIQLDDGYQPAWGEWLQHNEKFPQGIDGWAKDVRGDGFEPGLWLSPFTIDKKASIFREHPDAVLRDARGRPMHGGFLINRWIMGLDPTHPATQEHVRRAVDTIVHQWGISYLKLDFLYCGALPGKRYDPRRTRAQALRDGLALIREAAGEKAVLVGCGCPAGPALGLIDIMRVSPDCAPRWRPYLLGFESVFRHDPSLPATRNAIRNSIHRSWTHRRWWWLDADNLLAREQQTMTAAEIQSYATIIGLTGSHLVQSDDLTNESDERLRWVASLLPVSGEGCQVPNLLTAELPDLLIQHRQGAAGSWLVVGLFNWSDHPAKRTINLQEIGFPAKTPVIVCDFWKGWLSIQRDTLRTNLIPPHGAALFGLREVTPGAAQLAGSTMHFSMGSEITMWKTTKKTVRLHVTTGHQVSGTVWLKLPAPPKSVAIQGEAQSVPPTNSAGIYAIPVVVSQEAEVRIQM